MKSYPKVVQQIHNEFDSYGDAMIREANEIINKRTTADLDKAARLRAVGFTSTPEVVETEAYLAERKAAEKQAELVTYYAQKYPFQKFITQDGVDRICSKYTLVCAPVSRFSGFVPDVKLKQIEQFRLDKADKAMPQYKISRVLFSDGSGELHKKFYADWISADDPRIKPWHGNEIIDDNFYFIHNGKEGFTYNVEKRDASEELLICAPQKDFDLTGLKKHGFSFFKSKPIPDPVVLQAVKGGYLILAAWGDEASDPEVVNQINN